jgi:inactivated superfamily I helicase
MFQKETICLPESCASGTAASQLAGVLSAAPQSALVLAGLDLLLRKCDSHSGHRHMGFLGTLTRAIRLRFIRLDYIRSYRS